MKIESIATIFIASANFQNVEAVDVKKFDEINSALKQIEKIDFGMIKLKLQDSEDGNPWTTLQCEQAEADYKRFLALKKVYPNKEIVPNRVVDKFWHQHILDTVQYADDSQSVFGYFLHHFPYFGMRDEKDYQNLVNAFNETSYLYFMHFGFINNADSSRCRTQCKPQKCK
jgi:hypothetical protein